MCFSTWHFSWILQFAWQCAYASLLMYIFVSVTNENPILQIFFFFFDNFRGKWDIADYPKGRCLMPWKLYGNKIGYVNKLNGTWRCVSKRNILTVILIAIICLCRVVSGIIIMVIGGIGRYLDLHTTQNKYWLSLLAHDKEKSKFPMLFQLQVIMVLLFSPDLFFEIVIFKVNHLRWM